GVGRLLEMDEDVVKVVWAPPPEATPPPPTKARGRGTSKPTAPPKTGATTGVQAVAASAPPGRLSALPKPLLWGGLAGLIAILGVGGYLLATRSSEPPPAPGSPGPAAPAAPRLPTGEARTKLGAALAFLDEGRDGEGRLRSGLDSLTTDELAALPATDCERVDAVRYALALEQREALPSELPAAMKA